MANDISTAVWRIDTTPFSYPYPVYVLNLNITDCTAADHVVITQNNGKGVVDFTANASQLDYRIGKLGMLISGLKVATGGLGTTGVVTIATGAGK